MGETREGERVIIFTIFRQLVLSVMLKFFVLVYPKQSIYVTFNKRQSIES